MDEFIRKQGEVIEGVLSCFDRMLFRGYLPISDQFPSVDWVRVLGRYARRINPLLGELLRARESVRANVSAGDDPSLVDARGPRSGDGSEAATALPGGQRAGLLARLRRFMPAGVFNSALRKQFRLDPV
jgi:hypothetical protein